jgi:hypothetical protein
MLIIGLKNIAKLFGRDRQTISRWIRHHGFIARRMPNGHWVTSLTFVDEWIAEGHRLDPLVTKAKPIRTRSKRKSPAHQDKRPTDEPVVHKTDAD